MHQHSARLRKVLSHLYPRTRYFCRDPGTGNPWVLGTQHLLLHLHSKDTLPSIQLFLVLSLPWPLDSCRCFGGCVYKTYLFKLVSSIQFAGVKYIFPLLCNQTRPLSPELFHLPKPNSDPGHANSPSLSTALENYRVCDYDFCRFHVTGIIQNLVMSKEPISRTSRCIRAIAWQDFLPFEGRIVCMHHILLCG